MRNRITLLLILFILKGYSQCWQSIEPGRESSFGIKTDGTLWSWGRNSEGMLGQGPVGDLSLPTQIGNQSNWSSVSAGKGLGHHVAAIKTDGTLWTWGSNEHGQLANGTYTAHNIPTQAGTQSDWHSVSSGNNYILAIKTNGTLWSAGSNSMVGTLGTGGPDTNVLTQIGTATNWVQIVAAQNHAFGLKADGTLWAWGGNSFGCLGIGMPDGIYTTPIQVGTAIDWEFIDADGFPAIALKTDGTLWTWGSNFNGELGIGSNVGYSSVPVNVPGQWDSVAAGAAALFGIKPDGTLWGWGNNSMGSVGDGTSVNKSIPVQIGILTWEQVYAGNAHTFALDSQGELLGWGWNNAGQLGSGSASASQLDPFQITPACTLKVNESANNNFVIFPNPATEVLKWQSENLAIDHVMVFDVLGKIVIEEIGNRSEINIVQLREGFYFLQIRCNDQYFQSAFIKK